MTNDEWTGICTLLEHGWPGEFGDAARASYRILLDGHEPNELVKTLRVLVRQGGAFRPSVSEIAAAAVHDPTLPAWPEALRDIRKALRVQQSYFATAKEKERVCVLWLEKHSHDLVARFFEAVTWERLSQLPLDDPEYGQLETKRLADQWEQFLGRAQERQARGLPAGGSRTQLGPRTPDFAGVLEAGGDE